MRHETLAVPGAAGATLFGQCWLPDAPARAVALVVHGLAEHSGRYGELAARLAARGYAVYAVDHPGHGRSPGQRANIGRFDHLLAGVESLRTLAASRHPGLPVVLVGHSMGGAVAFAHALQAQERYAALVLSGPLLATDPGVSRLRVALVRWLSERWPGLGALQLPATAVSRDPEVVRAYQSDPLVHGGAIPARTLAELVTRVAAFPGQATSLRLPVLVLHGTADALVRLADTRPVYERIGSPDCTVKLYDGLYHEVFNEPERERVFADLTAWLDARVPAPVA